MVFCLLFFFFFGYRIIRGVCFSRYSIDGWAMVDMISFFEYAFNLSLRRQRINSIT